MNRNSSEDYNPQRETLEQYGARLNARLEGEKAAKAEALRTSIEAATAQLTANRLAQEAEVKARQEATLSKLRQQHHIAESRAEKFQKMEARSKYQGTDASFEEDWPTIRAKLQAERIAEEDLRDKADMQRRLRHEF